MEERHECIIPLHKPSLREKIFFFISGLLVSVPFALFLAQFYDFLPLLISGVVMAPFIEELAKVFPLFYRHGETQRSIVNLGVLIGLGFGITEFVLYVFLLGVTPLARVAGVVFHASSAGITAYGIAKKNPLPYYLISVTLHVVNNFFAYVFADYLSVIVGLLVLFTALYLIWYFYYRSSKTAIVV